MSDAKKKAAAKAAPIAPAPVAVPPSKKPAPAGGSSSKKPAPAPAPSSPKISERPSFYHAVDGFLRAEGNFESSALANSVIEEVGAASALDRAFEIPLKKHFLSMDAAFRWVLFLSLAPARAAEEGDEPFDHELSVADAFTMISQVYDLGVQGAVWDHFVEDEDEEEDEEDEEAEEEGDE